MTQRSRVTVTIVVSLVTLLFSTVCSAAGIYAVSDHGVTLHLHPVAGFLMIGLGVVVWVGPPLFWLLPARASERDRVET
jgi:Na+/proline symporter